MQLQQGFDFVTPIRYIDTAEYSSNRVSDPALGIIALSQASRQLRLYIIAMN